MTYRVCSSTRNTLAQVLSNMAYYIVHAIRHILMVWRAEQPSPISCPVALLGECSCFTRRLVSAPTLHIYLIINNKGNHKRGIHTRYNVLFYNHRKIGDIFWGFVFVSSPTMYIHSPINKLRPQKAGISQPTTNKSPQIPHTREIPPRRFCPASSAGSP